MFTPEEIKYDNKHYKYIKFTAGNRKMLKVSHVIDDLFLRSEWNCRWNDRELKTYISTKKGWRLISMFCREVFNPFIDSVGVQRKSSAQKYSPSKLWNYFLYLTSWKIEFNLGQKEITKLLLCVTSWKMSLLIFSTIFALCHSHTGWNAVARAAERW
jgi:hypothetical protein